MDVKRRLKDQEQIKVVVVPGEVVVYVLQDQVVRVCAQNVGIAYGYLIIRKSALNVVRR